MISQNFKNPLKLMDENLRKSLLQNIELVGVVDSDSADTRIIVNGEVSNVIDKSSGRGRIRLNRVGSFNLILSQPSGLLALSPFEIRCLNCRKVISYPAWWLELKYSRSNIHYFICFNGKDKPNLECR